MISLLAMLGLLMANLGALIASSAGSRSRRAPKGGEMPDADHETLRQGSVDGEPTKGQSALIGRDGDDVLALAFEGGGFNTAIQLGVAHALIVSEGRPPDLVAGISAGAINAAVLADVLQAGEGLTTSKRKEAQFTALRRVIDAFQRCPSALARSALPDPYEVNEAIALDPLSLPTHLAAERIDRHEELRSRAGLTHLTNLLLEVRLSVSVVTQAVRRVLGIRASAESPFLGRWFERSFDALGLWWLALKSLPALSPLIGALTWAIIRGEPLRSTKQVTTARILYGKRRRQVGRALRYAAALVWTFLLLCLAPILVPLALAARGAEGTAYARFKRARPSLFRRVRRRILGRFAIAESLAQAHNLRETLIRLFDPNYYGTLNLRKLLDRAVRGQGPKVQNGGEVPPRRSLASFRSHRGSPVYVAPIAADVATGRLCSVPQSTPVVDALLAATAVVPLFPAVRNDGRVLVDGMNVANEPTSAIMDLLRRELNPRAAGVTIVPVSPLPVEKGELDTDRREHVGSVDTTWRVLELQRFRDALLERRLTELYSALMPRGRALYELDAPESERSRFVRARIHSIEPEEPIRVTSRLATARDEAERRQVVLDGVADGCRIALEAMIQPSIRAVAAECGSGAADASSKVCVPCAKVVAKHLGASAAGSRLPGVYEVCASCCAWRGASPMAEASRIAPSGDAPRVSLQVRRPHSDRRDDWVWPGREASATHQQAPPVEREPGVVVASEERHASSPDDPQPPWTTLLFSGGVFRGVFQVGVLNGLNEAGVQPRLIAGASVGSIMGAMAAKLLTAPQASRAERMSLLAATFLTLDRLVLTDRFADAVRSLTLRAAATHFSLRDADLVFRRYDSRAFDERARRVMAGLERLLYLSPFELADWVRAARDNDFASVVKMFRLDFQEYLDRMGVGEELLGAEPLELLIRQHVLSPDDSIEGGTFAEFHDPPGSLPVDLLAVATNLTRGRLETIPKSRARAHGASLSKGLLASSAFPVVFKPLKSWEIFSHAEEPDQYVDGGVMDNLPLHAVASFLHRASRDGKVAPRPGTPHLLLAASLEPDPPTISDEDADDLAQDWPSLLGRVRQLRYNRKIASYAAAQRNYRRLSRSLGTRLPRGELLDLEVVAIKPQWLCGTFAFHRMLGFRRHRQAESIAHGCATTLVTLSLLAEESSEWAAEWGLAKLDVAPETVRPVPGGPAGAKPTRDAFRLDPASHRPDGKCWFRKNSPCPFSAPGLPPDLPKSIRTSLPEIYEACGRWATHQPR